MLGMDKSDNKKAISSKKFFKKAADSGEAEQGFQQVWHR